MKIEESLLRAGALRTRAGPDRFRVSLADDAVRQDVYRLRHDVYAQELGQAV